jgi:histidinol dehydrogenase
VSGTSAGVLRFSGSLAALSATDRALLMDRAGAHDQALGARVAGIIARVRAGGDRALLDLARELDGVTLESLEVPRARRREALARCPDDLRRALDRAATNLETAHRAFKSQSYEVETEPGVRVGRRPDPLARVGIYAPGGSASYPSSVLMCAVPACVAGVADLILCSPPLRSGLPDPVVLAAAEIAGVQRVFAIGGAGAIAAMVCGTASVPRVDRIVGPGNAYVAEAKLQLAGEVGMDSPAGPSELLVIADESADPEAVARELMAQAEHDPRAVVAAIALSCEQAERIERALERVAAGAERRDIVAEALGGNGAVLWAESLECALAFASDFAPEHLMLAIDDPRAALPRVRNAGAVFVGLGSSVVFGDYLTGANHVLPTGGAARRFSGLSTQDFVRWTSWQEVSPSGAARLAGDVVRLAKAERLPAHADAACGAADYATRAPSAPSPPEPAATPAAAVRTRAAYRDLVPYAEDAAPCAVDLSDNTNLFGTAPAAARELRCATANDLARYPSAYSDALRRALANYTGVAAESIVTGCGSDDVIDSALRACADPGERVAFPDPTFSMVPVFVRANGLTSVRVPLTRDLGLDADALLATGARVIYLCSPNNPTGGRFSQPAIERVIARSRGVVLLDEAYAEFCGGEWFREAPARGNLLVVRTLSKAFGLAGLRIGYAAGGAQLVREVMKARGPYKVGTLAERAAVAALNEDREWMRERVRQVVENRERFVIALAALGITALPSAANFVLVPVPDAPAAALALRRHSVSVREFHSLAGIGDALRISIGPWPMLEVALAALKEAMRCV